MKWSSLRKLLVHLFKKQFCMIAIFELDHFRAAEKMFINMKWSSLQKTF